jgi:hypothetical protein
VLLKYRQTLWRLDAVGVVTASAVGGDWAGMVWRRGVFGEELGNGERDGGGWGASPVAGVMFGRGVSGEEVG